MKAHISHMQNGRVMLTYFQLPTSRRGLCELCAERDVGEPR
jgi:hypothetical protein